MLDAIILAATLLVSSPQQPQQPPVLPDYKSGVGLFNVCFPYVKSLSEEKSLDSLENDDQLRVAVCVSYFEGFLNGRMSSDKLHGSPSFCTNRLTVKEAVVQYMQWSIVNKDILDRLPKVVAVTYALHERWGCHEENSKAVPNLNPGSKKGREIEI